jgi:hypothetical protein
MAAISFELRQHMMHLELMNSHALAPRYATRNLLGSTASTILLWKRPAQKAIPSMYHHVSPYYQHKEENATIQGRMSTRRTEQQK